MGACRTGAFEEHNNRWTTFNRQIIRSLIDYILHDTECKEISIILSLYTIALTSVSNIIGPKIEVSLKIL